MVFEPFPALIEPTPAQAPDHQWGVLERFGGVD